MAVKAETSSKLQRQILKFRGGMCGFYLDGGKFRCKRRKWDAYEKAKQKCTIPKICVNTTKNEPKYSSASMSFYEFLRNNNFHWTFWKMIFGERKINSSCLFVCFFQHKISTVVVISRFLKIAQWAISYILMNDPHSEMCCFF